MVIEAGDAPRIIDEKTVYDPLPWLEAAEDEALAWLGDQAKRARTFLAALPGDQSALAGQIRQALSYEMRTVPLERNGRYFFLSSPPGAERASLWLAPSPDEAGREVLHPARLDLAEGTAEIQNFWPAPDGSHALLAVTHGGRQSTQVVVISIEGEEPAGILERLDTPSLAWASWCDGDSFFWSFRDGHTQVLALRNLLGDETLVELPADVAAGGVVPIVSEDGAWLAVLTYTPGVPGCRLFVATNVPSPTFVEIVGLASEDLVLAGWCPAGLALVPRRGDSREVILADLTPLRGGGVPILRPLYQDDTGRLAGACIFPRGDLLLIDRADDGGNAFRYLARDGRIDVVDGGVGVTWGDWAIDRSSQRLIANFLRWDVPSQLVAYDSRGRCFIPLRQPAAGLRLWTGRAEVVAEDGTHIPVTLLKPRGMEDKRDLPCLLWGYGGFGISIRPCCMMNLEPWLAAGGMVAIAHVRGGGELGPAWHEAGRGANKLNSFIDLITVARWLAASRHTKARRLCLWGASAGGLLVLGSAVLAPECCAAVIAENPVADMAKFTRYDDDGRYWTVEFGDPDNDPVALASIARWSPLHNLNQGCSYPASLITVARNDERVSPVHGRKMTAALLATGSPGPHLLMELEGAGHGGPATVTDGAEARAALLRFAAWATGLEWPSLG